MLGRDGTRPMSLMQATAEALKKAICSAGMRLMLGFDCCAAAGLGRKLGGRCINENSSLSRKERLLQQKEVLQSRLNAVPKELERV